MKNYIKIKRKSLFYSYFMYIDDERYYADALFAEQRIRVYFGAEMQKEESKYRVIFSRVRKRDAATFIEALGKLPDKMLLLGNTDYEEACKLLSIFEEEKENV